MDNKGFATAIRHALQSEKLLPEVRIEYSVHSGTRYGAAWESEQTLNIQGNGAARVFRRRSPAGTDAMPAGSFQGQIPMDALKAFLGKLEKAPLHAVPSELPSPTDPVYTLTVVAARKLFRFNWGPPAPPLPPELDTVFDVLAYWVRTACPTPLWSLSLTATAVRFTGEGIEATVRLENAGSERIYVVHPASPSAVAAKSLALRHGILPKEVKGVTPPPMEVEEEFLEVAPLAETELVPVSADLPLEFTIRAPSSTQGGNGRVGIFSYTCYALPSGAAGLPVFTGAVFSKETVL